MNTIKEILYSSFSDAAIISAAICEQLEDVSYCSEHGMNHMNGGREEAKWNAEMKKADAYARRDDFKTFNKSNIAIFKKKVKKFLSDNPETKIFDKLSDKEKFAVRYFYYHDIY